MNKMQFQQFVHLGARTEVPYDNLIVNVAFQTGNADTEEWKTTRNL